MNEQLLAQWLNQELDEGGKLQLENSLRDEPESLNRFFDAVQFQEQLRALYRASPQAVQLPRIRSRVVWGLGSAVAATMLIAIVFMPSSGPRPTADPRLFVLNGHPKLQTTEVEPGPQPFATQREKWPTETHIVTDERSSTLRWHGDYILEIGPNTTLTLTCGPDGPSESDPLYLRLDGGNITMKLAVVVSPIDIWLDESRVRIAQPTVFAFSNLSPQPGGFNLRLTVSSGSLEVRTEDGVRNVLAGENTLLP